MQNLLDEEVEELRPPWDVDLPVALRPDGSPAITSNPPGGVDLHSGKMTASRLAARLNWNPCAAGNEHPVRWLSYMGRRVPIDISIAALVGALWNAGYVTLACCEGNDTETESGYVMFSEAIGKAFMEWVQAHEQRLPGDLTRRFELLLQDDDWHAYMRERYPLLEPVGRDDSDRLFTLCWRFHRQDLLDHGDAVIELLRAGRP